MDTTWMQTRCGVVRAVCRGKLRKEEEGLARTRGQRRVERCTWISIGIRPCGESGC